MTSGRIRGLALAGLALLMPGCKFDAPFKYSTTVHTEVVITDGLDFTVLDIVLGEPFEIDGGRIDGKLKTHLGRADAMTAPRSLDWRLLWLNEDGSQTKGTYDATAQGKMRPAGSSSYTWTYLFQDAHVPSWNVLPNDRLRMVLQPSGGTINSGWDIKTSYTWHPQL